jgi:hypothetical protein
VTADIASSKNPTTKFNPIYLTSFHERKKEGREKEEGSATCGGYAYDTMAPKQ